MDESIESVFCLKKMFLSKCLAINLQCNFITVNIYILVKELCKLPKEVGWVEFKHKNYDYINLPVICW